MYSWAIGRMTLSNLTGIAAIMGEYQDQAILELAEENKRLALSLFWRDHKASKLSEVMRQANMSHPNSPFCKCCGCLSSGRWTGNDVEADRWTCRFESWMKTKVAECGMFAVKGCKNQIAISHDACNPKNWVIDVDAHIILNADAHLLNQGGYAWNCFTYGRKLYNATSVDDIELQKLRKLFETLSAAP
jgi:hypothetical protein